MVSQTTVSILTYCTECQLCFKNSSFGGVLEEAGAFRKVWWTPEKRCPVDDQNNSLPRPGQMTYQSKPMECQWHYLTSLPEMCHLGFSSEMQQFPQEGGHCSSVGGRGDKAKIEPSLWVNLTSALHSTSFPNMPLQLSPSFAFSSMHSELSLGSIHMSLPNSQVASCVVSLQLDYKLLKVCASPRFSPIMSTQIWAGVQERVAERRAQ